MKKEMTKRGWLLGLLVGLVMMVGAVPAMAGYIFVGDFYNSAFALETDKNDPISVDNKKTWSSIATTPLYLYQYNQKQDFYVAGVQQTEAIKDEDGSDGWGVVDGMYQYVIVKSGQYIDLYKYSAGGPTIDLVTAYPGDSISHISGYNAVPIPGAVWLLGSGLGALLVARRRRK